MTPEHAIEEWRRDSETQEGHAALADPAFRGQIYRSLHPNPDSADHALLLRLLELEMKYRGDDTNSGEHFENLYWCGLLVQRLGIITDVLPLWRAKNVNFDASCGFDAQFLVGAGVEQTLDYLSRTDHPQAKDAYDYLIICRDAQDFEDLDLWLESRISYFA
jgi:hypothetical protein